MDRIINVKINGNYLTKDNNKAGVKGEANVTALRITFDEGWDGYAKTAVFWDARGENPVRRILTADLLENRAENTRVYICPIPGEPLAHEGFMTFVVEGAVNEKVQRSVSDELLVEYSENTDSAAEPEDPTPSQAEQLQSQIEALLDDVSEAAKAAGLAEQAIASAEQAAQHATEATLAKRSAIQAADRSESYAKRSEDAAAHAPYIESNGLWCVWDEEAGHYVHSINAQGPAGKDGKDGYTPVKGEDYFDGRDGRDGLDGKSATITGMTAVIQPGVGTPEVEVDLSGTPFERAFYLTFKNLQGAPGKDGVDGYTPVKGVDYFDGEDGVDGKDGVSVTAEVIDQSEQSGGMTRVRFYTKSGTNDIFVYNGLDGMDGLSVYSCKNQNVWEKGDQNYISFDKIDFYGRTPQVGELIVTDNGFLVKIDSVHQESVAASLVCRIKGSDGDDGYTPVKDVDYFDGKDGHTPVKGVDYYTEEERTALVDEITDYVDSTAFSGSYNDLSDKPELNFLAENNPVGTGSFSLNRNADSAVGACSVAAGHNPTASGYASHAEGMNTVASGEMSHTEGLDTTASGKAAHAEGWTATASGEVAHAEGNSTNASGEGSHAEGGWATASGDYSHAEGYYTRAAGDYQHVQGKFNVEDTADEYAHIVGNGSSTAARSNAHTIDWDGNAWFAGDVRVGKDNERLVTESDLDEVIKSTSDFSGSYNDLRDKPELFSGNYEDLSNKPELFSGSYDDLTNKPALFSGAYADLTGKPAIPDTLSDLGEDATHRTVTDAEKNTWNSKSDFSGSYNDLTEKPTLFSGKYEDLSGKPTLFSGSYNDLTNKPELDFLASKDPVGTGSFSMNRKAGTGIGFRSVAVGSNNEASGSVSHAEGTGTTASGETSHAEGRDTTASGRAAHAEGLNTTASGVASHTEGFNTTASSDYSHAEGMYTTASGKYSHAEGAGTTAASDYQHAQGKYNIVDEEGKYAHIVGNGFSDALSNAHTLDWDGNAWFAGDVTVGEGNKKLATEEYVDNHASAGGGATIIDVLELPTENIDENVFYRTLKATFVSEQGFAGGTCYCVEGLPTTGEPVTMDGQSVNAGYYNTADGDVYGYLPSTLASAVGVPAGWYPFSTLASVFGITWFGTIVDIADCPEVDGTSLGVLLEGDIWYYKYDWRSVNPIGWHGEGKCAEVFNYSLNSARGSYSHAEGLETSASGFCCHAEGWQTVASADDAHAEGTKTVAASHAQHVQGQLNIVDDEGKYLHIVGNGWNDERSNAHTLDWDGNAWYSGSVTVQPYGDAYSVVKKNANSTGDYGLQLQDYSADGAYMGLTLCAESQKFELKMKAAGSDEYVYPELYHSANPQRGIEGDYPQFELSASDTHKTMIGKSADASNDYGTVIRDTNGTEKVELKLRADNKQARLCYGGKEYAIYHEGNLPSGGGGGSSWNDLPDKPFYSEGSVDAICSEFVTNTGTNITNLPDDFQGIENGETYIVNFDGVEYKCVGIRNESLYLLGNLGISGNAADTGEPFLIQYIVGQGYPYFYCDGVQDVAHTVSIYHDTLVVKTLDGKFLPEGVGYIEDEMVEVLPEYTVASEEDAVSLPHLNLVAGETYNVEVLGFEFECVAVDVPEMDAVCLGDLYTATGGQLGTVATGEPFFILEQINMTGIQPLIEVSLPVTVRITCNGATVHTMDARCLPDVMIVNASAFEDTADKTSDEIWEAIQNKQNVLLAVRNGSHATYSPCVQCVPNEGAFFMDVVVTRTDGEITGIDRVRAVCVKPDGSILKG